MESFNYSSSDLHRAAELLEIALSALKTEVGRTATSVTGRVGTMGPLTCSAEALTMFLYTRNVTAEPLYFSSFDEVFEALLRGEIEQALVPHCHPIASELLFDSRFEFDMSQAFDKPNPPLYLAALPGNKTSPARGAACAALPTLWPLVKEDQFPELTMVATVSNPAAAKALRDGLADYAITNEASLAAFELRPVRTLKHVVVRWFPVRARAVRSA